MPCHQYRFNPAWQRLRQLLTEGAIGRWHLAEMHVYRQLADPGIATQEHLPGARIVRAFNQLNNKVFLSEAHRAGEKVAVPLGGDDKEALAVVARLVTDAGFEPVIVGSLAQSKAFDSSAPIFLKTLTARELRAALKLPQP